MRLFILIMILFFELYKNDIVSEPADILKRDQELFFTSQKSTDTSLSGNNQALDLPAALIKFDISDKPQTLSVTNIDDFHPSQFTHTHNKFLEHQSLL